MIVTYVSVLGLTIDSKSAKSNYKQSGLIKRY